jgi:hypothetical protein
MIEKINHRRVSNFFSGLILDTSDRRDDGKRGIGHTFLEPHLAENNPEITCTFVQGRCVILGLW